MLAIFFMNDILYRSANTFINNNHTMDFNIDQRK